MTTTLFIKNRHWAAHHTHLPACSLKMANAEAQPMDVEEKPTEEKPPTEEIKTEEEAKPTEEAPATVEPAAVEAKPADTETKPPEKVGRANPARGAPYGDLSFDCRS